MSKLIICEVEMKTILQHSDESDDRYTNFTTSFRRATLTLAIVLRRTHISYKTTSFAFLSFPFVPEHKTFSLKTFVSSS